MSTPRKARYSEAEKQRFAQQRHAELDAMHDRLVVGVSSLVDGEQWQAIGKTLAAAEKRDSLSRASLSDSNSSTLS